jgi:hypothetical protein
VAYLILIAHLVKNTFKSSHVIATPRLRNQCLTKQIELKTNVWKVLFEKLMLSLQMSIEFQK